MTRKIITSLLVITVAATLIGLGTFAYFSDIETSRGNTFTAGTLDLLVNGKNDPEVGTTVTLGNMCPSQHAWVPVDLTNDGSQDGIADIHYASVVDSEPTSDTEPETEAEKVGGDKYDISNWIVVDIWYDANNNGVVDGGEVIVPESWDVRLSKIISNNYDLGLLKAKETRKVYLSFHLHRDTPNEYQGDMSTFVIDFTLHQP